MDESLASLVARLQATGAELVRVTGPRDRDCACLDWIGAVISLTGQVKGLPTLKQAVKDGLFHRGCRCTLIAFSPAKISPSLAEEAQACTVHAIRAMNARAKGQEPPPLAVRRYIHEINSRGADPADAARRKFERVYNAARKAQAAGDEATFRLKCRAALDILRTTSIYGARQQNLIARIEASMKQHNK